MGTSPCNLSLNPCSLIIVSLTGVAEGIGVGVAVGSGVAVGVSVGEGVCVGTGVLVDSIVGSGLGVAGTSVGGAASGVDVAVSGGMVAVGAAAGMEVAVTAVGTTPSSPVRPSPPQAMAAMIDNVNKPNRLMNPILFCIVIYLIRRPWMSNQTCSPTMLCAEVTVSGLLPIT
jgi:hypothetical protein